MNQISVLRTQVPAHIAQAGKLSLNANAHQNLPASFAVLSYKGKVWRLRYRGEDTLLEESPGVGHDGRPRPVAPVSSLPVVVVGIASSISKAFYDKRYSEGGKESP